MLLVHDAVLPSATSIVVGRPVEGSWWSHPRANDIYDAIQPLDEVATRVKLVTQKQTFVHRRLWPALVAVGTARANWQMRGLSEDGAALLSAVARRRTPVATRDLMPRADTKRRQRVVREVEQRLLLHTDEVHTESGAHAKYAQTWRTFARANGIDESPTASAARAAFEAAVSDWPPPGKGRRLLPWLEPRPS